MMTNFWLNSSFQNPCERELVGIQKNPKFLETALGSEELNLQCLNEKKNLLYGFIRRIARPNMTHRLTNGVFQNNKVVALYGTLHRDKLTL